MMKQAPCLLDDVRIVQPRVCGVFFVASKKHNNGDIESDNDAMMMMMTVSGYEGGCLTMIYT